MLTSTGAGIEPSVPLPFVGTLFRKRCPVPSSHCTVTFVPLDEMDPHLLTEMPSAVVLIGVMAEVALPFVSNRRITIPVSNEPPE